MSDLASIWKEFTRLGNSFIGRRQHLRIFAECFHRGGAAEWNRWRSRNPSVTPNLSGIALNGRDLPGINLRGARLANATFGGADLEGADLRRASLRNANFFLANLYRAKVSEADLTGAWLNYARLEQADFRRARLLRHGIDRASLEHANLREALFAGALLREAEMTGAILSDANFAGADLRKAKLDLAVLSGTSFLGAKLSGASLQRAFIRRIRTNRKTKQKPLSLDFNMWVSRPGWLSYRHTTVNDLRVAQFYDVIAEHGAVGKLISAGSMSVVLILGRFTVERKRVLEALAQALRVRGKTPVIFDFQGPENRELIDTVRFIGGMAELIVVDLTAASSVPLELQALVPDLMVPVLPIVQSRRPVYAMFADLVRRYFWVLPPVSYSNERELLRHLDSAILRRAGRVAEEIKRRRQNAVRKPRSIRQARQLRVR